MTTDYRALCAELLQAWDDLPWEYDFKGNPVGPLAEIDDTPFERARSALAQPEPVGPTDEELYDLFDWLKDEWHSNNEGEFPLPVFARAVLARWGNPSIYVVPCGDLAEPEAEPVEPTDEELVHVYQAAYQPAWERGEFHGCHVDGLRAVLARYGRPTPQPIPVSERLPGPEDLDDQGTCWMFHPVNFHYCLCLPDPSVHTHWLPATALSVPDGVVV